MDLFGLLLICCLILFGYMKVDIHPCLQMCIKKPRLFLDLVLELMSNCYDHVQKVGVHAQNLLTIVAFETSLSHMLEIFFLYLTYEGPFTIEVLLLGQRT